MCGFCLKGNILRLNKSLSGDTRIKVWILLVLTENQEVILKIFKRIYGKPDVHKIIKIAQKLSEIFSKIPARSKNVATTKY